MTWNRAFLILSLLIGSSLLLSGCGPEIPNDQMKLAVPSPSPSLLNQSTTSPSPLTGKDIMIDQPQVSTQTQPAASTPITAQTATIITNKGAIKIKLYPDQTPQTVQNFLHKAQTGFYQNLTFHRVEDWVIQGGDPKGNGTGGGTMPTELTQTPFKTGSVGVARGGDIKVSNDAQFFICTQDCSWLTGQYTNFGEVISGMDVVKQIQIGDKISSITYE